MERTLVDSLDTRVQSLLAANARRRASAQGPGEAPPAVPHANMLASAHATGEHAVGQKVVDGTFLKEAVICPWIWSSWGLQSTPPPSFFSPGTRVVALPVAAAEQLCTWVLSKSTRSRGPFSLLTSGRHPAVTCRRPTPKPHPLAPFVHSRLTSCHGTRRPRKSLSCFRWSTFELAGGVAERALWLLKFPSFAPVLGSAAAAAALPHPSGAAGTSNRGALELVWPRPAERPPCPHYSCKALPPLCYNLLHFFPFCSPMLLRHQ